MNCLRITASSDSPYSSSQARCLCGLRVALATIATCGCALSICAIVSYLPPSAGYCGGVACILSLITLVICSVNSRRNYTPIIDPSLIDRSDYHTNPNIQNGDQVKHATHDAQRSNALPDELYTDIFSRLNGEDLARASQVCKRWNRLAKEDRLWEVLCLQESMIPEEQLYNYHGLYGRAKILNKKIRTMTPQVHCTQIDVSKHQRNNIDAQAFLKTRDHVFLYLDIAAASHQFEMWDASLSTRLFSMPIREQWFKNRIKLIGTSLYLIGRSHLSWEQIKPPQDVFRVYACELKDNNLTFQSKWRFNARTAWYSPYTKFELGKYQAYISRHDGIIDIVDLKTEGIKCWYDQNAIEYSDQSNWNLNYEHEWEASFSKTTRKHVRDVFENGEWKPIWMEEGEYERCAMYERRENSFAIQKRKQLIGHMAAISALRVYGNYLFSSSEDGTIKQWNLSNYTCACTIDTGFKTGCCLLQIAGRYIFGLERSERRTICQWDMVSNQCIYSVDLEKECLSFYVTGNILFCLCQKDNVKTVEIYDLSTNEHVQTLACPGEAWESEFLFEKECVHFLDSQQIITWDFSSPH